MPPRSSIAIDFFRRRLRAVEATITRGSIHVNRVISVEIPEEIPLTDDESVGRWIRDALLRRGMEVGRAVVAVNRDDAVVRRITLPTREVDELADMVALSMKRDLPIDAEHAEIDPASYVAKKVGNTKVFCQEHPPASPAHLWALLPLTCTL